MPKVFVASRNAKKLEEMQRILEEYLVGVEVVGLDDLAGLGIEGYAEPVEDAPTFEGNALIKARAGYEATGLPTVADDSGLCVDALNGMPGVLSARWSGPPNAKQPGSAGDRRQDDARNNALLLAQLADVPDERRGAHFTCAVAFRGPAGEIVVEGRMDGRVIRETRGDGGFGYDVLFVPDEAETFGRGGATAAELDREQKDAISHRGKALAEIAPLIARTFFTTA